MKDPLHMANYAFLTHAVKLEGREVLRSYPAKRLKNDVILNSPVVNRFLLGAMFPDVRFLCGEKIIVQGQSNRKCAVTVATVQGRVALFTNKRHGTTSLARGCHNNFVFMSFFCLFLCW